MSHRLSGFPRRTRNQAGFTLVEVLVVLIIVAMVSGVLFEALERAYQLQNRFGSELFRVQQGQMAMDWYRQSAQGLYPDHTDGRNIFNGQAQEFSGLSGNPLGDEYGALTPITWKIRDDPSSGTAELVYVQDQQETTILTWRGKNSRFMYLDEQQEPHQSWPPPLGVFSQLPKQIQLVSENDSDSINITVSPRGPISPPLRLQDLFGTTP